MRPAAEEAFVGNPLEGFPWYISAALFRRDVFTKIGWFDEALRFGEDLDWFKRARGSRARRRTFAQHFPAGATPFRQHDARQELIELNALRVLKKALDRQRGR